MASKRQEQSFHLEATLGLVLALFEFSQAHPEHPKSEFFRREGDALWAGVQAFVADHGFPYSSQRIQDLSTLLTSSTALIWFIDVYDRIEGPRTNQQPVLATETTGTGSEVTRVAYDASKVSEPPPPPPIEEECRTLNIHVFGANTLDAREFALKRLSVERRWLFTRCAAKELLHRATEAVHGYGEWEKDLPLVTIERSRYALISRQAEEMLTQTRRYRDQVDGFAAAAEQGESWARALEFWIQSQNRLEVLNEAVTDTTQMVRGVILDSVLRSISRAIAASGMGAHWVSWEFFDGRFLVVLEYRDPRVGATHIAWADLAGRTDLSNRHRGMAWYQEGQVNGVSGKLPPLDTLQAIVAAISSDAPIRPWVIAGVKETLAQVDPGIVREHALRNAVYELNALIFRLELTLLALHDELPGARRAEWAEKLGRLQTFRSNSPLFRDASPMLTLSQLYREESPPGTPWDNAHHDIRKVLEEVNAEQLYQEIDRMALTGPDFAVGYLLVALRSRIDRLIQLYRFVDPSAKILGHLEALKGTLMHHMSDPDAVTGRQGFEFALEFARSLEQIIDANESGR